MNVDFVVTIVMPVKIYIGFANARGALSGVIWIVYMSGLTIRKRIRRYVRFVIQNILCLGR